MDEALNGFICTLCITLTSVLEEEFTLVASFLQGHHPGSNAHFLCPEVFVLEN